MGFTNFPYGATSFGIPLMGHDVGIPYGRGGKVWFVASPDVDETFWANDSNAGDSSSEAFATIARAISVAEAGDTIIIYSGSYAENLVVNKDYLTFIGAQLSGYGKPDIVPTTALALYNQAAQGMVLRHLRLAAPAVAGDLMRIEGNGFLIEDCVLDGDAAQGAGNAIIRLKGNDTDDSFTASEGIIRNCLCRGGIFGIIFDTAEPTVGVGETDDTIDNCVFVGNTSSDIATADTGPGTYSIQRGVIKFNVFETKTKTNYIDLTTSNGGAAGDQNGIIMGNYFNTDTNTTTNVAMIGTGFGFVGNFNITGVASGTTLD